jgi:hypothetical protein
MELVAPHATLAVAAPPNNQQNVNSWQIATKHGTQSGVGVSVSGSGAWAKLLGDMSFTIRYLEQSKTFDQLKSQQSFSSGVSGFWAWLGLGQNKSTYQEQIHQAFHEMSTSQAVQGSAHFDLECSGQYPNVQVDASAFVLVLQIQNDSGNTFNLVSSTGGAGDTGAQDQNGNTLPTKNNNSTITI